ncbi:MAG: cation:proton antiporter [Kiritimatiellae bacterium]|nr:cation:proton antiporter [Kiritimatiellia bacterium]
MTESALIQDLAMMMAIAGLVSVLFAKLKWPKVIGYIFAGILMSRHTWGGSFLADENSVQTIGQLGIVFLMFTLGLGFSTSEMKKLKNVTVPTAIFDTVVMTYLGYTVGTKLLGWGAVESLFLGAAICDSSTTLLAKVIDEMKWSSRRFSKYVVGTSVCEDIICIGIIALITGVAAGNASFAAVGKSLGGLFVFFLATIFFGLVLVPRLLDSVARRHDDEALLLTLLGCCFFVTWIAFKLNFSLALGAFLVGILGASSDVRRRLHELADPLRSMFAAVFFVSIGLLVNPASCWENLPVILGLSALVMIGKGCNCFLGGLISGESLKTSVQMGFSLAQIGEFAYMVALLYLSTTNDSESQMYQIVVGVSLLTTVLNPVMIRLSDPAGDRVEKHCPARLARWLGNYREFMAKFHGSGASRSAAAIRKALIELVVIAVIELAIVITVSMMGRYDWSEFSEFFERNDRIFLCLGANVIMLAMFAPVLRIARTLGGALGDMLVNPGASRWQQAVHNVVNHLAAIVIVGGSFVWMVMLNVPIQPSQTWAKCAVYGVLAVAAIAGWRFFSKAGHRAFQRFDEAAKADERRSAEPRQILFSVPEDAVHKLTLTDASPAIGATVVTLNIRAKTGASVVSVIRDGKTVRNIGAEWEFRIGDTLVVMGDAHQLAALKDLLGVTV